MPGPGGGSQINSLMDLVQPQAAAPDTAMQFMGYPPGFSFMEGGGAMAPGGMGVGGATGSTPFDMHSLPYMQGAPWGMTRADFESPLAYTSPNWQPRDTGGWYTTEQLYSRIPGGTVGNIGPSGRGGPPPVRQTSMPVPQNMSAGANLPSTSNWRLLGNDPRWIMRNGRIIDLGSHYRFPPDMPGASQGVGGWLPANTANAGTMQGEYPFSGTSIPSTGYPGFFQSSVYWPGQTEKAMPIGLPHAV